MSKHTPAPWVIMRRLDDELGPSYTIVGEKFSLGEIKANAKLIAKSPDLLRAAVELEKAIAEHIPYVPTRVLNKLIQLRNTMEDIMDVDDNDKG